MVAVSALYSVVELFGPKKSAINVDASEACGIGLLLDFVDTPEGMSPALGGGDRGPFPGGVGSGRLELCSPRPIGALFFTGLAERKPAPIMAAFSSSCVGSLIGDLTRGAFSTCLEEDGRSHNDAAFLTETAEFRSPAVFVSLGSILSRTSVFGSLTVDTLEG